MDTLITLQEASSQYSIPLPDLRQMARDGKIWSAKLGAEVMVAVGHDGELKSRDDGQGQATQPTRFVGETPVPIPDKDETLRGQPIRVTEAAERYGICHANLSRWADAGYIRVLERRRRLLVLDEADVKFAAEVFKRARSVRSSSIRAGWVLKQAIEQMQA